MLVQWTSKVDALLLYMAQLEEKIKIEVAAREELAKTYECSLNQGVQKLNTETSFLAENPLIKEISLVVAKELLAKSKDDKQLTEMLRQKSMDNNLLNSVFQQVRNE